MTDITIPPEALEAAARAYAVANDTPELWWRLYEEKVRAACIAMLRSWPGITGVLESEISPAVIILPLPKEASDEPRS